MTCGTLNMEIWDFFKNKWCSELTVDNKWLEAIWSDTAAALQVPESIDVQHSVNESCGPHHLWEKTEDPAAI